MANLESDHNLTPHLASCVFEDASILNTIGKSCTPKRLREMRMVSVGHSMGDMAALTWCKQHGVLSNLDVTIIRSRFVKTNLHRLGILEQKRVRIHNVLLIHPPDEARQDPEGDWPHTGLSFENVDAYVGQQHRAVQVLKYQHQIHFDLELNPSWLDRAMAGNMFLTRVLTTHNMFPCLQRLILMGIPLQDGLTLHHLQSLRELHLGRQCNSLRGVQQRITNQFGPNLTALSLNQDVQLWSDECNRHNFAHIAMLDLSHCVFWPGGDNGNLRWLAAIGATLTKLCLRNCQGMSRLTGLPEIFTALVELDVSDNTFSPINFHPANVMHTMAEAFQDIIDCRLQHGKLTTVAMNHCLRLANLEPNLMLSLDRQQMVSFFRSFPNEHYHGVTAAQLDNQDNLWLQAAFLQWLQPASHDHPRPLFSLQDASGL